MKKLGIATLVFAAMSLAGDVSGTWAGDMEMKREGETRPNTAHLVLSQTGNEIKGSVGPRADKQMPITKGTVNGSEIILEAKVPDKDARMIFNLKIDGEKLSGTLRAEGPGAPDMIGTMTLSRMK